MSTHHVVATVTASFRYLYATSFDSIGMNYAIAHNSVLGTFLCNLTHFLCTLI